MQPILDILNTFTKTVNATLLSLNERMSKLEESQEQVNLTSENVTIKEKTIFDD